MTRPSAGESTSGGEGIGGWFIRLWSFTCAILIAVKWNIVEMLSRHRKMNLQVMPKRAGDTAIVTGGSRGIGAEVVKQFMILDMHVIIGCRTEASGIKLIDKLRKEGIQSGTAEVLSLDLESFRSVREFAQNLLDRNIPINILVNNAGIMFVPYHITVDGFESHFQTNFLSHFLLTNLLMPLLVIGGSPYRVSRVVNVSSIAHFGGKIDFDDLNMDKMYDKHMGYMSSKLMQVVSTKDLNARLKADGNKPVRIYSVHPGVIFTELYDKLWYIQAFGCIVKKLFKTAEQGADGIVYCAASPEVGDAEGGEYFMNCQKQTPNPIARDPSVQQKLWSTSQGLVGLKSSLHNDAIEIITLT